MTTAATVLVGRRESFSAAHELCDPRLRNVKTSRGWAQGYNAQAATTPSTVNADSPDSGTCSIQVLIPPDAGKRQGSRPGWDGGLYSFMRRVLDTDFGGRLYARRQGMIQAGLRGHQLMNDARAPAFEQVPRSPGRTTKH
jgi:hypothetical protein